MGRKKQEKIRDKIVAVRLLEDEYKRIEDVANDNDMSISEYMRNTALKKRVCKKVKKEDVEKILYLISKISTNINQIAKKVNANAMLETDEFKETNELYKELISLIKNIVR